MKRRGGGGAQPAQLLRPCGARGGRAPGRGGAAGSLQRGRGARRGGVGDRRRHRGAYRLRLLRGPAEFAARLWPRSTEVAHAKGVPVLVDAASQIPPTRNLRRFLEQGADLVSISGGKAILGPQGSGILCGRRDLVASALLQNLDQDLFFEQWRPSVFALCRPQPARPAPARDRPFLQGGQGADRGACSPRSSSSSGEDIGERNRRSPVLRASAKTSHRNSRSRNRKRRGAHRGECATEEEPLPRSPGRFPSGPGPPERIRSGDCAPGRLAGGSRRSLASWTRGRVVMRALCLKRRRSARSSHAA